MKKIIPSILLSFLTVYIACGPDSQQFQKLKSSGINNIPPDYKFLLFPKDGTMVYKTPEFSRGDEIAKLERAITVQYSDLNKENIGVIIDEKNEGYVRRSSLRFLPRDNTPDYKKTRDYIAGWVDAIKFDTNYAEGYGGVYHLQAGKAIVYFRLVSADRVCGSAYNYETNGDKIIAVGAAIPLRDLDIMVDGGTPIFEAYRKAERSIPDAETFIKQYSSERELCAGAMLNIARLYERQSEVKQAIDMYQKAIDEYGEENVPRINSAVTVRDWALSNIGLLYKNIGERSRAIIIFEDLMKHAEDRNTRNSSRIEYLSTKQSHLKVTAEVTVQGKKLFSVGKRIPVLISVENSTKETVIFKCYAQMEFHSFCALAPREGSKEITLTPGAKLDVPLVFTEKDTKACLIPGVYKLTAVLTGIPFDTNTELVKIRE
ncbi:MAG: tetratricopeptide repeat protein [candidate division Zixibacteria bacterium]|nr:tetratricopeptide repeat protein [candidate division Zixibacteria bacterium]